MMDAVAAIKPNSKEIGKSGSVHSAPTYWKAVVNSTPPDGVTWKVPGCGGPFVVTTTDDSACKPVERLQTRENVRVALSGSE